MCSAGIVVLFGESLEVFFRVCRDQVAEVEPEHAVVRGESRAAKQSSGFAS